MQVVGGMKNCVRFLRDSLTFETVHLIFQLITCNFVLQADPTAHLALSLANRAAVLVKLKFFKEATQENRLRHLAKK